MKLDDIYKTVEAWDKEIKKELSETASASINMSGDNAEDVIKLMNALKGEKQADSMDKMPVAIKKGPEMEPVDSMAKLRDLVKGPEQGPMDKPEPMDMKIPMKIDAEADEVVPEEEWDNSPDEDYKDANYMNKTLSGGSEQGVKKSYPKVAGGDNPMALEDEIKSELKSRLEAMMAVKDEVTEAEDKDFDESGCVGEMKKLNNSGCTKEEMKKKITAEYDCDSKKFEKLYASHCG